MITNVVICTRPILNLLTFYTRAAMAYARVRPTAQIEMEVEKHLQPIEFRTFDNDFRKRFADPAKLFKVPCYSLEELQSKHIGEEWQYQYHLHMTKVIDRKMKALVAKKILKRDGVLSQEAITLVNGPDPSDEVAHKMGEHKLWVSCLDDL